MARRPRALRRLKPLSITPAGARVISASWRFDRHRTPSTADVAPSAKGARKNTDYVRIVAGGEGAQNREFFRAMYLYLRRNWLRRAERDGDRRIRRPQTARNDGEKPQIRWCRKNDSNYFKKSTKAELIEFANKINGIREMPRERVSKLSANSAPTSKFS